MWRKPTMLILMSLHQQGKKHEVGYNRTSPNIIHGVEDIINKDAGKSMRSIERKLNMSGAKIHKIVAEDIR